METTMQRRVLWLLTPLLLAPMCGKDDTTDSNTLPDGGATGSGTLSTGLPGTGGTTDVTTTENLDCVIAWSDFGSPGAVVIASADGNEVSRVSFGTTGAQPESRVVFSPDGTRLAFVADNLDDGSGGTNRDAVFTMTLEGTEQREASGTADFFSTIEAISWSADGTTIAFWGVDWGEPRSQSGTGPADYIYWLASSDEVFTARIDGTSVLERSEDTTPPYDYDAVDPAFSPVGSLLAWVQYSIDYDDLVLLDTAGSGPPTVFDEPHHFRYPAWSPDGSKIYFGSDEGGTWNIWSMAPDGSNRVQLTEGMRARPSPDGNWLLVQLPDNASRVTDADGSNPIDLPADVTLFGSSWGPNATLYHFGGGGRHLYVYDVASGTDTKLVDQADAPDIPGVSPRCF